MDHSYCYVCQHLRPCDPGSPCFTLSKKDKAKAYYLGYFAKHRGKYQERAKAQYAAEHPGYKPANVRKLEADQRRAAKDRAKAERLHRRMGEEIANKIRWAFYAHLSHVWIASAKAEKAAIKEQNKAHQAQLIEKNQLRKERHAERLRQAQRHYQEALKILAESPGPGGGSRYAFPDEAQAARKRYKSAHAVVYAKTAKGKANARTQDSRRRIKGKLQIRRSRPDGVGDFYFRMLALKHQICFYCYKRLSAGEGVGDHFIPLAKGGEHEAGNLVVACQECNSMKRDMLPSEFAEWCYNVTKGYKP